ncbi:hypothetical protein ES705_31628 [subsurface metagenome]
MRRKGKKLRRYSRQTVKQITKGTGLPEEEVKRATEYFLNAKFMRRCYDAKGRLIPDLYELPESLEEIEVWRKARSSERG